MAVSRNSHAVTTIVIAGEKQQFETDAMRTAETVLSARLTTRGGTDVPSTGARAPAATPTPAPQFNVHPFRAPLPEGHPVPDILPHAPMSRPR
jgi:hypothetical protein